jgi:hypothetical protein
VSWVVRLLNIGIVLAKFIILHESLFELSVVTADVAVILTIHLSKLLLLILHLILLVPKSEIALILYLHRQVNRCEGRIKWLRLRRRERVIGIRRTALLVSPILESTLTRLVSGRVERRRVLTTSGIECQVEIVKEIVLVLTVEKVRQHVCLSLVVDLCCLLR